MTKMTIVGMLVFGMLLGNGWRDAGEIVYEQIQKANEVLE